MKFSELLKTFGLFGSSMNDFRPNDRKLSINENFQQYSNNSEGNSNYFQLQQSPGNRIFYHPGLSNVYNQKSSLSRYGHAAYSHSPPEYTGYGHTEYSIYPSESGWHGTSRKSKDSLLGAVTLLSFLFFLNVLHNCIKEHMEAMNPTVMVMTSSAGRYPFSKLSEGFSTSETNTQSSIYLIQSKKFDTNSEKEKEKANSFNNITIEPINRFTSSFKSNVPKDKETYYVRIS